MNEQISIIERDMKKMRAKPEFEDVNKVYTSANDFEGYNMNGIILASLGLFTKSCPVQFVKCSEEDYENTPMLQMTKSVLSYVSTKGPVKLTSVGKLPRNAILGIFKPIFPPKAYALLERKKEFSDDDTFLLNLCKSTLLFLKLLKQTDHISITPAGEKMLGNNHKLYFSMLKSVMVLLDWRSIDGINNIKLGKLGLGYSLILLNKYGNERREIKWYSNKYFKLLPELTQCFIMTPDHIGHFPSEIYAERTFVRCLLPLGLVKLTKAGEVKGNWTIQKTTLFDKLVKVIPPSGIPDDAGVADTR